jgi:hypothetical protein
MKNTFKLILTTTSVALLAACGGGGGGSNQLVLNNTISDLYGRISLNYNFTGSSRSYNDSAFFNSNSLIDSGLMLAMLDGSTTKGMACGLNPEFGSYAPYRYLCFISDGEISGSDAFIFNIDSSGQISGLYEYCYNVSAEACGRDLILNPDGVVRGSINKNATALQFDPAKNEASNSSENKTSSKIQISSESNTQIPSDSIGKGISEKIEKFKILK